MLFCFPCAKSALFSRNKRRLIIATTWIVSVALQTHFLYTVEVVSNATGNQCTLHWDPASYKMEVFRANVILVFCLIAVSPIALTVLYSSILVFLYRQKNNLHLGIEVIKRRSKTNRQITRMLVIVRSCCILYSMDSFLCCVFHQLFFTYYQNTMQLCLVWH